MTLSDAITALEENMSAVWVSEIMTDLAATYTFFSYSWPYTIAAFFVKKIVDYGIKKMDLGGYYLYRAVKNNAGAEAFQDAVTATKKAIESGDSDAISKAKAAQLVAARTLLGLNT